MTSGTPPPCGSSWPQLAASWVVLLALALLVACRHTAALNEPIRDDALDRLHARMELASEVKSGEVLVAVTFSGGGTRAAAFAYGVLRGLAETTIVIGGQERRLIDEIDLISSVSGGSFTAAYYGLHGDGIFEDYEDVFLRRNVQRGLVLEMLRPRYWLGFTGLDRSQLAARYYDRKIFHGARSPTWRGPNPLRSCSTRPTSRRQAASRSRRSSSRSCAPISRATPSRRR